MVVTCGNLSEAVKAIPTSLYGLKTIFYVEYGLQMGRSIDLCLTLAYSEVSYTVAA